MANEDRIGTAKESRRLNRWLWAAIFLGLFVYAWQGVQPHLLYYGFGVFTPYPVFSWDSSTLRTVFSIPGGVMNALAALLGQTYRDPLLGAAVIAAVLAVLLMQVRRLLYVIGAGRLADLAWVPPVLALMIFTRCDNPLPILLALGLSLWTAILYVSIPMKTLAVRAAVFLALFVLIYHVAGASALVFAGIACLTEALVRRRIGASIVQAGLAASGTFVLGRFLFDLRPWAVYTVGTLWDPARSHEFSTLSSLLTAALYAFVPSLVLMAVLGRILHRVGAKAQSGRRERKTRLAKNAGRAKTNDRLWILARAVAVAAAAVLCLALSRNHIRNERQLHYYASQRHWNRVIALAHRMQGRRTFTRSAVFDINRALAHEGRLGEELCAYPQDETKTLFLSFDDMAGRFQHAKLIELYLDLGCPNAAQKNAYELLDNEGPSPYVLDAMVRIHLVKGEYESARIAFGALCKHAGGQPYVRRWQDVIADPARADSHPQLQAWRRVRGTADRAVGGVSFEPLLKGLLHDTPGHRFAFEYLMAHYLLKHQRAEFMSCLPLLKPLGYQQLPRQYAEAVLVHALETRTSPNACGWTIGPDVQNLFREVSGVVKNARGNNLAVFDTLAPKFGGTYTFYSLFNTCGVR